MLGMSLGRMSGNSANAGSGVNELLLIYKVH